MNDSKNTTSGLFIRQLPEKSLLLNIKEIIEKNLDTYEYIAEEFANKYFEAQLDDEVERFCKYIPRHATIIDVGCGVGRDLHLLSLQGCKPMGLDISPAMLRVAKSRGITTPLILGDMLDLPFKPKSFDGAWVCASLLHFPKSVVEPILLQINRIAKEAIFISVIEGSGIRWSKEPGGNSRYFSYYQSDELVNLLGLSGFKCEDVWITKTGDSNIKWVNIIATTKYNSK